MSSDGQVIHTSTLSSDGQACLCSESDGESLSRESTSRDGQLHHMLLVQLGCKAKVAALQFGFSLPRDATLVTTQRPTGAGGIHLSKVNFCSLYHNNELVSWLPIINLVQGKLYGNSVCSHLIRTKPTGDGVGSRHLRSVHTQPSQELRQVRVKRSGTRLPGHL